MTRDKAIREINESWTGPRWNGVTRDHSAEQVYRLGGYYQIEYTLARIGAEKLWHLCTTRNFIRTGGVLTGHMAVQAVRVGWPALYASGWQVAGDANTSGETYPDQSLYPVDSMPRLVERLNNALLRQDEIQHMKDEGGIDWLVPIVADAEAGFGGVLNVFELMKALIKSGAAGVHFEDQLASEKKCGHMGGKVVIPTREFIKKLKAARFAADVSRIPTILIARTDAGSAKLIANDIDERDHPFITGTRNSAGFFTWRGGLDAAIQRGLAYAPYADMLWCETSKPDLGEAREFAEAIHAKYPGKLLAYNCSPSFNWAKHLDEDEIEVFQDELGDMGYRFQFITLFGFHTLNFFTFEIAREYTQRGIPAFVELQEIEFEAESDGYTAVKHQQEVGTGYFDEIQLAITGDETDTLALKGSTEEDQF